MAFGNFNWKIEPKELEAICGFEKEIQNLISWCNRMMKSKTEKDIYLMWCTCLLFSKQGKTMTFKEIQSRLMIRTWFVFVYFSFVHSFRFFFLSLLCISIMQHKIPTKAQHWRSDTRSIGPFNCISWPRMGNWNRTRNAKKKKKIKIIDFVKKHQIYIMSFGNSLAFANQVWRIWNLLEVKEMKGCENDPHVRWDWDS